VSAYAVMRSVLRADSCGRVVVIFQVRSPVKWKNETRTETERINSFFDARSLSGLVIATAR
jgi:hypothetical protein